VSRVRFSVGRTVLAGALALSLAGCSDAAGPNRDPCTGDVTITVSSGPTPTFTWTPACGVIGLLVEEEASDMWFISATGSGTIGSGVKYGTVPPGATEETPPLTLLAGRTYEVILFRGTQDDGVIAGLKALPPKECHSESQSDEDSPPFVKVVLSEWCGGSVIPRQRAPTRCGK